MSRDAMTLLFAARSRSILRYCAQVSESYFAISEVTRYGSSHEYMYKICVTYGSVGKDRTDPRVDRSRVRERGTSGHAAAH